MVQFAGKYKQTKEDKYEDFLKGLGLNLFMRKAAKSSTPTMEIHETSPGKWKAITATKMKAVEVNFESGKPFDEDTADGRKCTTTITIDGNKWITDQLNKKEGGPNVHVVREFSDEGIDVTFRTGNVVAKCFFQRQ